MLHLKILNELRTDEIHNQVLPDMKSDLSENPYKLSTDPEKYRRFVAEYKRLHSRPVSVPKLTPTPVKRKMPTGSNSGSGYKKAKTKPAKAKTSTKSIVGNNTFTQIKMPKQREENIKPWQYHVQNRNDIDWKLKTMNKVRSDVYQDLENRKTGSLFQHITGNPKIDASKLANKLTKDSVSSIIKQQANNVEQPVSTIIGKPINTWRQFFANAASNVSKNIQAKASEVQQPNVPAYDGGTLPWKASTSEKPNIFPTFDTQLSSNANITSTSTPTVTGSATSTAIDKIAGSGLMNYLGSTAGAVTLGGLATTGLLGSFMLYRKLKAKENITQADLEKADKLNHMKNVSKDSSEDKE